MFTAIFPVIMGFLPVTSQWMWLSLLQAETSLNMNFRIFISFVFCLGTFFIEGNSQDRTISGIISDAASGESLIGVNIYNPEKNTGAISNEFGFFSLKISPQMEVLLFSYTGYKTDTLSLVAGKDQGVCRRSRALDKATISKLNIASRKALPAMYG